MFRGLRVLLRLRAEQIHGLDMRLKQLEDNLALLESKHERLRGRVYGTGAHLAAPPPIDPHSAAGKAAVLAEWRKNQGAT